jgi:4-carboxymuconolactone decarboxylase
MARVKLLSLEEMDPELRAWFEKMQSRGSEMLNIYRVLAHSPDLCQTYMRFVNRVLTRMKLDAKLRELVILRVAQLTRSTYEYGQHLEIARSAGVSEEQIKGIGRWKGSKHFSAREKAVLQYTDELTRNIRPQPASFRKLKAFLSERELVELTLTVGNYGGLARFLEALQVELEDARKGKAKAGAGAR